MIESRTIVRMARFGIDDSQPKGLREVQAAAEVRGRWRTLVHWLQGAINAVDTGVIDVDPVFLPWLVGGDGKTVSEAVPPGCAISGAQELQRC